MRATTEYRFDFGHGVETRGSVVRTQGSSEEAIRYVLDDGKLLAGRGFVTTSFGADLLDACAAVSIADRLAPRLLDRHGNPRPRMLILTIPLRMPERWTGSAIEAGLRRACERLSGDRWEFRFIKRSALARRAEAQHALFTSGPLSEVVLCSGGLDSLLGIVQAIETDGARSLLAMTVATNTRQSWLINRSLDAVRVAAPQVDLAWGRLGVVIRRGSRGIDDRNRDHRLRPMLFLAAAATAADAMGCTRIRITENGPGALALPATPDQHIGLRVPMSVHPESLATFRELAESALERPVEVTNGALFMTKGEMCGLLADGRYDAAAACTVSCERFPYARWDVACGVCMSCLYRAAALRRAGVERVDGGRRLGRVGGRRNAATALVMHAADLDKRLRSADPVMALNCLSDRFDRAVAVSSTFRKTEQVAEAAFVDLYRRFVGEMAAELSAFGAPWALPTEPIPFAVAQRRAVG